MKEYNARYTIAGHIPNTEVYGSMRTVCARDCTDSKEDRFSVHVRDGCVEVSYCRAMAGAVCSLILFSTPLVSSLVNNAIWSCHHKQPIVVHRTLPLRLSP